MRKIFAARGNNDYAGGGPNLWFADAQFRGDAEGGELRGEAAGDSEAQTALKEVIRD